jgi:hypothetical protein
VTGFAAWPAGKELGTAAGDLKIAAQIFSKAVLHLNKSLRPRVSSLLPGLAVGVPFGTGSISRHAESPADRRTSVVQEASARAILPCVVQL